MKKTTRRVHKKAKITFDKYALYRKSVQSPDTDVEFFVRVYKELRKKSPVALREDFCGTAALSCEWVKLNKKHKSFGVDLDPEPMEYGRYHYLNKLKENQKKRIQLIEGNVLTSELPKVDIAAALNFSYFIFKTRDQIKKYFSNVYKSLNNNGIFIADIFGGSQCYDSNEENTRHKDFTYYWDQTNFDPVSNEALFYIHFRVGRNKIEKVFTYDWRLWSIPEIREIMTEVGFKKTNVYWEGTTKKGEGDGVFTRTEQGEACLSWIAYIVAEK